MSKESGGRITSGQVRGWLVTALVAGIALNILFAVIRAYLPLMAVLVALIFVVRVLWRLTR